MDPAVVREDMVDGLEHASKACVESPSVSTALRAVPREPFVPEERAAYEDRAHEAHGTRVLAPSTVGRLLEALAADPDDTVLVVGAGVGYTAAALAEIVGPTNVHAIDITRRLVYAARDNLGEAGYEGVLVDCQDGAAGLPEYAPFDRILLEAAAVEPPAALLDQLAPDGRLVFPRGLGTQRLVAVEHDADEVTIAAEFDRVQFQPLLVEGEQPDAVERNRTVREDRERAARSARSQTGWEHEWIEWDGKRDA
jgi:protein-L-isoaspartate(D-aspartate) O-methyltransferase